MTRTAVARVLPAVSRSRRAQPSRQAARAVQVDALAGGVSSSGQLHPVGKGEEGWQLLVISRYPAVSSFALLFIIIFASSPGRVVSYVLYSVCCVCMQMTRTPKARSTGSGEIFAFSGRNFVLFRSVTFRNVTYCSNLFECDDRNESDEPAVQSSCPLMWKMCLSLCVQRGVQLSTPPSGYIRTYVRLTYLYSSSDSK